jgi:hypothetical protein
VHQIQIDQEQGPATCLTCCQAETQVALVLRVCSDAGVKSRFTFGARLSRHVNFLPVPNRASVRKNRRLRYKFVINFRTFVPFFAVAASEELL